MKANDLIRDVSSYLSDQEFGFEFEHWSSADLFRYFKLAVAAVAAKKPASFVKATTVRLKPGAQQDLPAPCENVVDQYVTNAAGTRLRSSTIKSAQFAFLVSCVPTEVAVYAPKSVSFLPGAAQSFLVEPPAPEGVNTTVQVNCFAPPEITSPDADVAVPSTLEPVVFEMMLYYAFGVDTESVASRSRSELHFANAMLLLAPMRAATIK